MTRKTIKLYAKEREILKECIRRIQCFSNGDMTKNLLMLSYRSEIQSLIDKGILRLSGNYAPRCLTWSHLTERGLRIMRQLKRKGLFCNLYDYSGNSCGIIPHVVTIYE